ncbi:hypothetical protein Lsan_2286 [Legionella santicrucis]|uniref:Uncharacterized protein n=1 Tax=Legionella santicrucis TaxID=45074 RepID=A0A0W0YSA5_9GAMM|nr:hypothetical protein Lsan_2286 [Legionella santicrucis]
MLWPRRYLLDTVLHENDTLEVIVYLIDVLLYKDHFYSILNSSFRQNQSMPRTDPFFKLSVLLLYTSY